MNSTRWGFRPVELHTLKNVPSHLDFASLIQDHKRFAELFRRSKFVQLGDFEGRIVIGEIVRRLTDDLYIDMGLKFHAVCKAPTMKNELVVRLFVSGALRVTEIQSSYDNTFFAAIPCRCLKDTQADTAKFIFYI